MIASVGRILIVRNTIHAVWAIGLVSRRRKVVAVITAAREDAHLACQCAFRLWAGASSLLWSAPRTDQSAEDFYKMAAVNRTRNTSSGQAAVSIIFYDYSQSSRSTTLGHASCAMTPSAIQMRATISPKRSVCASLPCFAANDETSSAVKGCRLPCADMLFPHEIDQSAAEQVGFRDLILARAAGT